MGLFKKREKREHIISESDGEFLKLLASSDKITVKQALSVPAVSSCVSFISNVIASLPIKLYSENGKRTSEVFGDPRLKLLNDETGDLLDAYQAKKAYITDVLLCGVGYFYINRKRNNIISLNYVDRQSVNVYLNTDPIYKSADILVCGVKYEPWEFIILTLDSKTGVTGTGIVDKNNSILAAAYNISLYEQNLYKHGGGKRGFIQVEEKLSDKAFAVFKEAWNKLYSNKAPSEPMVFNKGVEFHELNSSATEMQMNENKETNTSQICSLFNLSPKIINGTATADEFANGIKTAVTPLVTAFQTALNKSLLLENEKSTKYFACDLTELMKGDLFKRYQAYKLALDSSFMLIDEVRYKEDLSPLGFDYIKLGLDTVLLNPKTRELYTANTNALIKLNEGVASNESRNQKRK